MIRRCVVRYMVAVFILHTGGAASAFALKPKPPDSGNPVSSVNKDLAATHSSPPSDGRIAGGNPACDAGTGDCFSINGSAGCDDVTCCNRVCDADSLCCQDVWDSICADEAEDLCGCVGEGNCFAANGTPSCSAEGCCSKVCAEDSSCCGTEWDCQCAEAASRLCGQPSCPGDGDCMQSNGTPGCDNEQCCNTVCLADPECCSAGWDSFCVSKAQDLCGAAVGEGNCMAANGTPGCGDSSCSNLVCADSPWCCDREWDAGCAATAADLCAPPSCPADGDCFSVHANGGCDDEFCCSTVCLDDPVCCSSGWDNICVDLAGELCSTCPGSGHCDEPNATPGCENRDCCESVCSELPLCCVAEWDAACTKAALRLCGDPACPGTNDCSTTQGTGCNDVACCNAVCLQDFECCATGWDSLCVQRAAVTCGVRNDVAPMAIPLSCGETHPGATLVATPDGEALLCNAGGTAFGVWYRVTGNGGDITIDTCNDATNYDSRISVFGGDCPRALDCIADNDNTCGDRSSVTWASSLGERYLVLVHGAGAASGTFELSVCCTGGCDGDFEPDGDIDLVDVSRFLNCFTGVDRSADAANCLCGDFDGDGRVDWEDFSQLLCAFEGN